MVRNGFEDPNSVRQSFAMVSPLYRSVRSHLRGTRGEAIFGEKTGYNTDAGKREEAALGW